MAFRNVLSSIPTDTAVDELSMQALIAAKGLHLVYEPQAIVYNRGPTTVRDYLRQRRRICAGHLRIARQEGYVASTMSTRRVGRAVLAADCFSAPNTQALWTVGTITLEATARALGYYDFVRHRPHHIWTAVATTKGDLVGGARPRTAQNVLLFHVVDFVEERLSPRNPSRLRPSGSAWRKNRDPPRTGRGGVRTGNGTIVAMLDGERDARAGSAGRRARSRIAVHRHRQGRRPSVAPRLRHRDVPRVRSARRPSASRAIAS